ncbi:VirB4 family type IV secretion system protein [Halegenticoccus tardaugens]|uniref:VirB4 family type IV secretion system protein n=1 Tax=Halegenticoccus tardaugens TaxID=2071624 RepID=UPI00100B9F1B|nr:hypothetical protein [Halegenticoccus tardaugens]
MNTQSQSDRTDGPPANHITLPYIDTSIEIWGPIHFGDLKALSVPLACAIIGIVAVAADLPVVSVPFFAVAGLSLAVCTYAIASNPHYMGTKERVESWVEAKQIEREMPLGWEDALGRQLHGVEQPFRDGTVCMADGRTVAMLGVRGMNSAMLKADRAQSLTSQLGMAIDEDIRDFDFSMYATTDESDPETLVEHLEDRALGRGASDPLGSTSRASKYLQTLLLNVAEWFVDVDEPQWQATPWDYYIVVESRSGEGTGWDPGQMEHLGRMERLRARVTGSAPGRNRSQQSSRQQERLKKRVRAAEDAFGSVEGVEVERVDLLEHIGLLARYWTSEKGTPSEATVNAMANDTARVREHETATERLLTPSIYQVDEGRIRVGDHLTRTYHIMGWPAQPQAMFLGELFTLRGVNLDVRIHCHAEDKNHAMDELERHMADVDSEERKRLEEGDMSGQRIQSDKQAAYVMYDELHNTSAQPWQVSMYVTVRAGPDEAYEVAESSSYDFENLHMAKVKALEDACSKVLRILKNRPANLSPRGTDAFPMRAFESGSPTGRDAVEEDGEKAKTTRMLGGAIGAMFPWCTGTIQEKCGVRFGRNKQNGTPIIADPFKRGAAPHALTIGQSRSGKTYCSQTGLSEWYAARDDRTLIVCDTEGGFTSFTKALDGRHIEVGSGEDVINPFEIRKAPRSEIESGKAIGNFERKCKEVSEFFASILRSQGSDPGNYYSVIGDAVRETYKRAGITDEPETHARKSPDPRDFIDALRDILNNAEADRYTFTSDELEIERKRELAAKLLEKLSGFREGNEFEHMLGETSASILDPDERMIYLDLKNFNHASEAEKSVQLHLMLGQIGQKIKRAPGETIFLIDEAHLLMHSREMVEWLQNAARAWARYDACLWFVTQSPREFIERARDTGEGEENQRSTILEQCTTRQVFRTPMTTSELFKDLGMNDIQTKYVMQKAVPGKAQRGYSECLINFQDREGWWECHVEAAPFQDVLWNYSHQDDGDFDEYLRKQWYDRRESQHV